MRDINYETLPQHMQEGIRAYVETGRPVGDFLSAVITNDFVKIVERADSTNASFLKEWAAFLYNEMPTMSWGSEERYDKWISQHGLIGEKE